jgi:galactokinase/mevalonate kinase-like predicted kinase
MSDIPKYYEKDYGCVVSTAINKYIYIIVLIMIISGLLMALNIKGGDTIAATISKALPR